jgi:RNA polymerase sigma factor (sigma-70 family)
MSDDLPVTDLMTRAAAGDKQAWDSLVEQYAPLVWSICRRHRLSDADVGDISQNIWRQLAGQLGGIRDPAALPGWLAATTRRECGKVRRAAPAPQPARSLPDTGHIPDEQTGMTERELRKAGQHAALREAFTRLPPCCQQLIALLLQDPPVPDPQISATLGIPVSSIRPSRRRCLDKLRHDPSIAALINARAPAAPSELPGQAQAILAPQCGNSPSAPSAHQPACANAHGEP